MVYLQGAFYFPSRDVFLFHAHVSICVDVRILKQGDCGVHWRLISIIFPTRSVLMIILRTMGTIQSQQATLPALDFHDANYTTFENFGARLSGHGKRSHASGVTPAAGYSRSTGTCRCGTHLARRWRPCLYRIAARRDFGYITAPILSRGNPAFGKMGHPEAPGICGQSGTPHIDSNADRDRKNPDAFTSRPASGDGSCSHGTHLTNASASADGDLQQLTHFGDCHQTGAGLD